MNPTDLIACPQCDALLRKPSWAAHTNTRCPRCGALLYRAVSLNLEPICAITLGALITFIIAQTFPIIELNMKGITSQTTLFGALVALWNEDMGLVAAVALCSTILFPCIELLALLYLLLPMRVGIMPPGFNLMLRAIQWVRPWGMIEVFMLGILVTIVKMSSFSRVIPETALFAFAALTLMLAVVVMFDPRILWEIAHTLAPASRPSPPPVTPAPSPPREELNTR